jgi:hypothetical protein
MVHRAHNTTTSTSPIAVHLPATPSKRENESLRCFFGYLPSDVIKTTFEKTIQYACMPISTMLKKRYKSPNPAMFVHH